MIRLEIEPRSPGPLVNWDENQDKNARPKETYDIEKDIYAIYRKLVFFLFNSLESSPRKTNQLTNYYRFAL